MSSARFGWLPILCRSRMMMKRRWMEIDNCFQVHGNAWVLGFGRFIRGAGIFVFLFRRFNYFACKKVNFVRPKQVDTVFGQRNGKAEISNKMKVTLSVLMNCTEDNEEVALNGGGVESENIGTKR